MTDKEDKMQNLKDKVEHHKKLAEDPLSLVVYKTAKYLEDNTPEIEYLKTNSVIDFLNGDGLSKKSLTILVGGTGDGKSLLLAHIAYKLSEQYRVLYLSFENASEVDAARFRDCEQLYPNSKPQNVMYINVLEEGLAGRIKWDISLYGKLVGEEQYDFVCMDALQTTIDGIEQNEIHRQGNILMKYLYGYSLTKGVPLIMSWQASRESAAYKLDKVSQTDISGSYGTARYCTDMFYLKRETDGNKSSRKIKLLKARGGKNAKWGRIWDLELSGGFSVEVLGEI